MHPTFIQQLAAEHRRELVAEASARGHGRHPLRPDTHLSSRVSASTWWGRVRQTMLVSGAEAHGRSPVPVHAPVAASH
jgi:hypothetical protein